MASSLGGIESGGGKIKSPLMEGISTTLKGNNGNTLKDSSVIKSFSELAKQYIEERSVVPSYMTGTMKERSEARLQRIYGPFKNLSLEKLGSILAYTDEKSKIYEQINTFLRVGKYLGEDITELEPIVDNLKSALSELSSVNNQEEKELNRVVSGDYADYVSQLEPGEVIEEKGFGSWTGGEYSSPKGDQFIKKDKSNAVLTTKSNKAIDISPISKYEREAEHLLYPGQKYEVLSNNPEGIYSRKTQSYIPRINLRQFASGGKITTRSGRNIKGAGVDTQLIAARPGEVVINKETVDKLGSEFFLGLNKKYGGPNANKPRETNNLQFVSGNVGSYFLGGLVAAAGRVTAMQGVRGAARGAVGGIRGGVRSAARGAVKRVVGGNKKRKTPREGMSVATKGSGSGGGSIVPFGGGGGGGTSSAIVPAPKSEVVPASSGPGKTILDTLNQIKSLLDQILQVEKEEKSKLEDSILDFVRRDERQKRDQEQAKQEATKKARGKKGKENPVVKGAKKAVGGLWDFISGIVGDFIKYKILDWISDPKNRKNVERLVVFFKGLVEFLGKVFTFMMDQLGRTVEMLSKGFEFAKTLLQPLIDIFTLKWLTNPKEFIDNIIKLPQTLLNIIPEFFSSLLNYISFGLFENIGKFVSDLISNLNPFNLFGGKQEDDKESVTPTPKKESGGIGEAIGGAVGMLNPMNWFGGGDKKESAGEDNIPKLEKGGIVGKGTDEKQETGDVTVKPLTELIKESKISKIISDAIKPFMDMMMAPFKVIGSAIVGLILRTVSKIPFVGQFLEPIIKMAASTFGVPTSVLTQLSTNTKEFREKKIDKEKLLEKLFDGFGEIKKSLGDSKEGENPFAGFLSSITNIGGSVAGFLGNMLFGGPAAAATRPPSVPSASPTPSLPQFASHADAGGAGVSQYTNTADGKSYQKNAGDGWSEMTAMSSPSPGLAAAAESLRGMSSASGPDGGANGCVWAVNKVYEKAGITPPWGSSLYVPTAESQMVKAGYQQVSYDQRQPGDVMVMYDRKEPPQAHIGVVLANGNVLSNSSGKASFSWESSPEGYNNYYGNTGKIYRRPNADILNSNIATQIPSKNASPSAVISQTGSKTGTALTQTQQENLNLRSSSSKNKEYSNFINNLSTSNTSGSDTAESPSIGQTLPFDGLYATFKTNL